MISKAMQKGINEQINKEFYSSYLYLAMQAWFANKNLPGLAAWMHVQSGEETGHGMKLYEHLLDRGGMVDLQAIDAPVANWKTTLDVFKEVQKHEAEVTASINALYELAVKEKDYPAQVLLHWFINEQVEEEKNAAEVVDQLEMVEARTSGVLMLDHRLGKRGAE